MPHGRMLSDADRKKAVEAAHAARRVKVKERRKQIKNLREQGFKRYEIAEKLGVVPSTITKDFRAIEAEAEEAGSETR